MLCKTLRLVVESGQGFAKMFLRFEVDTFSKSTSFSAVLPLWCAFFMQGQSCSRSFLCTYYSIITQKRQEVEHWNMDVLTEGSIPIGDCCLYCVFQRVFNSSHI